MLRRMSSLALVAIVSMFVLSLGSSTILAQDEATPGTAPASDHVKRAQFTTGITEREPDDAITDLSADVTKVFFFTEIMDMEGKTVTHRWIYNGETKAELEFNVGGPRWRVYSSKNLWPGWEGTWAVEVVDDMGTVLKTQSFEYKAVE